MDEDAAFRAYEAMQQDSPSPAPAPPPTPWARVGSTRARVYSPRAGWSVVAWRGGAFADGSPAAVALAAGGGVRPRANGG
eukprot:gene17796-18163_t